MTIRNMAHRLLASVAGAAAGSVVTWMAMDNDMLSRKKQFEATLKEKDDQITALKARSVAQPVMTMAFAAMATGTITMLKALTAR
jgi:hypothetical protein